MENMTIAAIQTEHGRITYDGKTVKVFEYTEAGEEVTDNVNLESRAQVDEELKRSFGISIYC